MKVVLDLKAMCWRYANGQCHSTHCLRRGGLKRGEAPGDYSLATCQFHEAVVALTEARVIIESIGTTAADGADTLQRAEKWMKTNFPELA